YLQIFISIRQSDWAKWLKIAQFSYNIKQLSATSKAPFEITRSYVPRMGVEPGKSKNEAAGTSAKVMKSILCESRNYLNMLSRWLNRQSVDTLKLLNTKSGT
ncbi:hypothetical protein SERLA73DRAFT_47548, partial [Serpula lacrymans var. lacrymans S7.3]